MSEQNINLCYSDLNHNLINFNHIKGFKVVFLNTRSLIKHFCDIQSLIKLYKIDILCVCETNLKTIHSNNEFNIDGYHLWRCDRTRRRGGGVAIYAKISHKIEYTLKDTVLDNDYETLILNVKQYKSKQFTVFAVYRPPNSKIESDSKLLEIINYFSNEELIIGGDINHNFYDNNNKWFESTEDLGLKQIIRSLTRITDQSSGSCIDHIYSNRTDHLLDYGTIEFEISDHKPVFTTRKLNYRFINEEKFIYYRNWKQFNQKKFNELSNKSFDGLSNMNCINNCVNGFNSTVITIFNELIPLKRKRVKNRQNIPYLTESIRQLINERNERKMLFNRSKKDNISDSVYIKITNN